MNKAIFTLIAIVAIILVLGVSFIIASACISYNQDNDSYKDRHYSQPYYEETQDANTECLESDCFVYPHVYQQKDNGYSDVVVQVKKEVCNTPKVVCKSGKCLQPIPQESGEGHSEVIQQVKIDC